jgi:hypothetical protein
MKNDLADVLSRLIIEEIPIPLEEIANLHDTSVDTHTKFPIHTSLIYQKANDSWIRHTTPSRK